MHCGARLSELHGALVFHRKCLGKRLGHQMYMPVFVEQCIAWVCAHLGFIVHTVSGISNRWSGIWGWKNAVENGMEWWV